MVDARYIEETRFHLCDGFSTVMNPSAAMIGLYLPSGFKGRGTVPCYFCYSTPESPFSLREIFVRLVTEESPVLICIISSLHAYAHCRS